MNSNIVKLHETNYPGFIQPEILRRLQGDHHAWVLYQELYHFAQSSSPAGLWFTRTHRELNQSIKLSPYQIRKASRYLSSLGLIKTAVRYLGNSQKSCYQVLNPTKMQIKE
jgi:replication initiation and membrane attachment protein DnaB